MSLVNFNITIRVFFVFKKKNILKLKSEVLSEGLLITCFLSITLMSKSSLLRKHIVLIKTYMYVLHCNLSQLNTYNFLFCVKVLSEVFERN